MLLGRGRVLRFESWGTVPRCPGRPCFLLPACLARRHRASRGVRPGAPCAQAGLSFPTAWPVRSGDTVCSPSGVYADQRHPERSCVRTRRAINEQWA